jgi:hypothetical protein
VELALAKYRALHLGTNEKQYVARNLAIIACRL